MIPEPQTGRGHRPLLVRRADVAIVVHGTHALFGPLNTAAARLLTRAVGTMWCAYVFLAIALVSFWPALQTGNVVVIVSWVSQSLIQLVLLPVIIVGQNLDGAHADARAEADHATLAAIHTLSVQQLDMMATQQIILRALDARGAQAPQGAAADGQEPREHAD